MIFINSMQLLHTVREVNKMYKDKFERKENWNARTSVEAPGEERDRERERHTGAALNS